MTSYGAVWAEQVILSNVYKPTSVCFIFTFDQRLPWIGANNDHIWIHTFQAGQSITHRGPHLWNTLPINIKELPKKHLFAKHLRKLFIENYWKLIFSNVVYFRLSLSIIWNNFFIYLSQIYYIWRILIFIHF